MKYERLTTKGKDGKWTVLVNDNDRLIEDIQNIVDRLAELEDKIENGMLKEAKKAEILVKPDTEFELGTDWYCGNCGAFLNKFIHGNYCSYCGAELIIPKELQG